MNNQQNKTERWEEEFDKEFKDNLSSDNPWKYAHPYLKPFISQLLSDARREERERCLEALPKHINESNPDGEEREYAIGFNSAVDIANTAVEALTTAEESIKNLK